MLANYLAKIEVDDKSEFTIWQRTVDEVLGEGGGAGQAGQEHYWDQPSTPTAHFVEGPAKKTD